MSLGKNIKRARKAARLTQPQLGKACGWGEEAQSRVSNYELDRREPTLSDLRLISSVTGWPLTALIEGAEESPVASLITKLHSLEEHEQKQIERIVDAFLKAAKATEQ